MNTAACSRPEQARSASALVEQCQREMQAYRRREPSNDVYGLELLHRAIMQGDQAAWAGLQQCLGEIVRGWLRCHPSRDAACCWESEENYVALAFERFWQATVQQRVAFGTFAGALAYLRASLHGALLDTLRAYSRPKEVSLPEAGEAGEPYREDQTDSSEVWEILQTGASSDWLTCSTTVDSSPERLCASVKRSGAISRRSIVYAATSWSDCCAMRINSVGSLFKGNCCNKRRGENRRPILIVGRIQQQRLLAPPTI